METESIDFLNQLSNNRLRKEIDNICGSYSNSWDVLAELCQNSVDAIRLFVKRHGSESKSHTVEITLDCRNRSIIVRDSGIGFNPPSIASLMAPHGTDKSQNDQSIIGEKGVGLTYVIFMSNEFELTSASMEGQFEGTITRAGAWKRGDTDSLPLLSPSSNTGVGVSAGETFTQIRVVGLDDPYGEEEDLFNQPMPVLEYILRTKTAVGSTRTLFDLVEEDVTVTFTLTGHDGKSQSANIKYQYLAPHELLAPNSQVIDFEDFVKKAALMDDRAKTSQLRGKCLRKVSTITRAGRTIRYYSFFVPSRTTWAEMSSRNQLTRVNPETKESENIIQGGIEVGTRGMPTCVQLTPPSTGASGYWPNLFLLIEDDSLPFDLGRKFIPSRTQGLLKEIAKDIFNDFIPFTKFLTTDPAVTNSLSTLQNYEKSQEFQKINLLPDLKVRGLHYVKHPDSQEAAVVAIFNQLTAQNYLKGYYGLKTGHKMTYDLWANFELTRDSVGANHHSIITDGEQLPVVIEFKYKAEDLLEDFEKDIKHFSDIDLIVAWDLDVPKFGTRGVDVTVLNEDDAFFHGSNYMLTWPGAYNLGSASQKPLIALRKFVDKISE